MGKAGHRIGFIRITLSQNICFRYELHHLKVDNLSFHMSVCQVFAEIQFIFVTHFR